MTSQETPGAVEVHVQVRLGARDQRRIFADGDHLIQLPCEGMVHHTDGPPMERSSIFLTELAAMPGGLTRSFADNAGAGAFLATVNGQLETLQKTLEAS